MANWGPAPSWKTRVATLPKRPCSSSRLSFPAASSSAATPGYSGSYTSKGHAAGYLSSTCCKEMSNPSRHWLESRPHPIRLFWRYVSLNIFSQDMPLSPFARLSLSYFLFPFYIHTRIIGALIPVHDTNKFIHTGSLSCCHKAPGGWLDCIVFYMFRIISWIAKYRTFYLFSFWVGKGGFRSLSVTGTAPPNKPSCNLWNPQIVIN